MHFYLYLYYRMYYNVDALSDYTRGLDWLEALINCSYK
jgi:hypothetical protein